MLLCSEANSREHFLPDLPILTRKILVLLGFWEGLEGLERSGRLVGTISIHVHRIHASGDLGMTKNEKVHDY